MGWKTHLTNTDTPRAADGLPCEGGRSPSQRLHAVIAIVSPTNCVSMPIIRSSDRHTDVTEPICSAAKAQPLNPMKVEAPLGHQSSRCALHHAETRLCISLPFSIYFIAKIARKRPELNRDKSSAMLRRKFWVVVLMGFSNGEPWSLHFQIKILMANIDFLMLCEMIKIGLPWIYCANWKKAFLILNLNRFSPCSH